MLLRRYDLIGVDLALRRPSSLAGYRRGEGVVIWGEILKDRIDLDSDLVIIDAPLSLPKSGGFRDFERKVISRGYRLLPIKSGPMRGLAVVGSRIRKGLESRGVVVLETHPTSALKALGIDRDDVVRLFSPILSSPPRSRDDIDALVCLLVGMLYLRGEAEIFEGDDGSMVLPRAGRRVEGLFTG